MRYSYLVYWALTFSTPWAGASETMRILTQTATRKPRTVRLPYSDNGWIFCIEGSLVSGQAASRQRYACLVYIKPFRRRQPLVVLDRLDGKGSFHCRRRQKSVVRS